MSSLNLKLPLVKNSNLASPHLCSPSHLSIAGIDYTIRELFDRVCNSGILH